MPNATMRLTPAQWDALERLEKRARAHSDLERAGVCIGTLRALERRGLAMRADYLWCLTFNGRAALNGDRIPA